uniref:C-type lectin domain-containing protein n=1 Tax=Amphiprion ocellaris TaxID=80972 RepID=A0AAQ5YQ16_AMPOC
ANCFCCNSHHNDLVTIYTEAESDGFRLDSYEAWIGLYRYQGLSSSRPWYWSHGGNYSYYETKWAHYESQYSGDCAHVSYSNKRVYGSDCRTYYFFICHEYHGLNLEHLRYKFIPQSKTWSEAQQYCRDKYDDLAYITYFAPVEEEDFPVWIGLHRDGETWKWSTGMSNYEKWTSGEPGEDNDCVTISSLSKNMDTRNCSDRFPFICIKDNLLLVKENKTWEEALDHCRGLTPPTHYTRYDLVSVQLGAEYDYVMRKIMEADTEEVWTGLRFLAGHWLWVNGADMMYPDLPLCPVDFQHCGSMSKNNNTEGFQTRDCTETRNFLCYRKN